MNKKRDDKKSFREHFLILLSFVILAFLFTLPVIFKITNYVAGDGGDALQFIWNLWHVRNFIFNGGSLYYTNMQFYPSGASLAFHSLSLTNTLFLGAPLMLLTNNLLLIYNILFLFNFVLAGYGMYLLIKYLVKNRIIAFIAGFVFAFSPLHMSWSLGWLNLASIGWMPLFFLFFIKMFDEKKIKNSILAALFLFLLALSSWTLLLIAFLLGLSYFVFRIIKDRKIMNRNFFAKLGVFLGVFILILTPFVIPIIHESISGGGYQDVLKTTSVTPVNYILPNILNPLWGRATLDSIYYLYQIFPPIADSNVAISYILLLISALFLIKARKRIFWLLMVILFFVLSIFSSNIIINSLLNAIPILKALRDTSRFSLGVLFSLVIIFSYALKYFLPRWGKWASRKLKIKEKTSKVLIVGVIFVLIAAECLSVPYPMWYGYQKQINQLPFISNKTISSENFTVLGIPSGPSYQNSHELYLQTFSDKPIIGGYLSREKYAWMKNELDAQQYITQDDPRSLRNLIIKYNVKYLIIYNNFLYPEYEKEIEHILPELSLNATIVNQSQKEIDIYSNPILANSTTDSITVGDNFDNTTIVQFNY